jgi:hypothetical protein
VQLFRSFRIEYQRSCPEFFRSACSSAVPSTASRRARSAGTHRELMPFHSSTKNMKSSGLLKRLVGAAGYLTSRSHNRTEFRTYGMQALCKSSTCSITGTRIHDRGGLLAASLSSQPFSSHHPPPTGGTRSGFVVCFINGSVLNRPSFLFSLVFCPGLLIRSLKLLRQDSHFGREAKLHASPSTSA